MRYLFLFYLTIISQAGSCQRNNTSHSWDTKPTNKTAAIRVLTMAFHSFETFKIHIIERLSRLGYEYDLSPNSITTKDKIVFNNIHAIYNIQVTDSANCIITGQESEPRLGGLSWKEIKKGPGAFGTPGYEKMMVLSEAMRPDKIYYRRD